MSDGIKKIVIKKNTLPAVGLDNEHYLRYRIVSDDRNRISHWSPVYVLESSSLEIVEGAVSISGNIVICVWDDEFLRPKYDVFVKNDSEEYVYHGTTSVHSYSFINQATSTVRVAIQVEGKEKVRAQTLTIYESEAVVV